MGCFPSSCLRIEEIGGARSTQSGRRAFPKERAPRAALRAVGPGQWEACQASRDRNAIYHYLTAVFDLVMWWATEGRAVSRARWALQLHGLSLPTTDEPFAAIILATADRQKVDRRTRSKWSRVLRYSAEYKSHSESLAAFVQRKGSINACAARFTRCLGRLGRH
jgi:hypothetical protein